MNLGHAASARLDTNERIRENDGAKKAQSRWKEMLICDVVLLLSFLAYSHLQERIMTIQYTSDSDIGNHFVEEIRTGRFRFTFVVVLVNRLMASFFAVLAMAFLGKLDEIKMKASSYEYGLISFSNVFATSSQYEALKWVTLPTQTLIKSSKTIPVMMWTTCMSQKTYTLKEYIMAVIIAIGCTVYAITGDIASKESKGVEQYYGIILMVGYLIFDGFTSSFQQKLFHSYQMTIYNQILYVNLFSSIISFVLSCLSGQLLTTVLFIGIYPKVVLDLIGISFAAVVGQFAIHYMIKEFGALRYATIMAIRQFLVVFMSNIVYEHRLTPLQLLAAVAVFVALNVKARARKAADATSSERSGTLTGAPRSPRDGHGAGHGGHHTTTSSATASPRLREER